MIAQDPTANADFTEHKDFYRRFVRFVIISIAAIATLLILMAYFLT
jgi:hypothetical protein